MADRQVLFPDPEGPKSTVMPGGTSSAPAKRVLPSSARTSMSTTSDAFSPAMGAPSGELGDAVNGRHRERGEQRRHARRFRFAVRLNGVIDGERCGLREAGNVAGDHQRHAEIAERLGVSTSRVRQYLAQGMRQCYIALYGEPA